MAIRLPDGSIQLSDGRIIYANTVIMGADLCEIIELCLPPPAWPFVSGGGGGGPGPQGPAGPAGSGGGGAGTQGQQGFQGTNPGPAGPQGSQGNQGLVGAGIQGPQGNQGLFGAQGNQGNQGLVGPQGFQGNDGPQGLQGLQGIQGTQGSQGALNPDIFAATRVVSLIPGDGTDTDIQTAINNLPAEGGLIVVKQGVYALTASLVLPDKPVTIRGCAAGDVFVGPGGTTIDLGANAFPVFTVPVTVSPSQNFLVEDIQFLGTLVAGQHLVSDFAGTFFKVRDAQISGIDRIFDAQASMAATIEDSTVFTANSLIDGPVTFSTIAAHKCLIFLNGPVGIGGTPSADISDCFINSFGTFTSDLGILSSIVQTRWASSDITFSGNSCRTSAMAMNGGSLTILSTDAVVDGSIFDSMAVGVSISGTRNSVVGARFIGVATPIQEVGAADFNLFDAINGFAGSVVIGGNSVTGTVVP